MEVQGGVKDELFHITAEVLVYITAYIYSGVVLLIITSY